jgi:hypothetical protein
VGAPFKNCFADMLLKTIKYKALIKLLSPLPMPERAVYTLKKPPVIMKLFHKAIKDMK